MKQSFIVELWSGIFNVLGKASPFYWACMAIPVIRRDYKAIYYRAEPHIRGVYYHFVEGWTLGQLLISCALFILASVWDLYWGEFVAVVYGMTRIYDISITQIDTLLFRVYRIRKIEARKEKESVTYTPHAIRSYIRSAVLLLHNYVELMFWFALFYHYWAWAFHSSTESLDSFFTPLNFSFVTMTSFGSTTVCPSEIWGNILVLLQSAIGLFMAILILTRFIAFLPWSRSMDKLERRRG